MKRFLAVSTASLVAAMSMVAKPGPNQTTKIEARVVAFDPILHLSSGLTSVKNREVLLVEATTKKGTEYMVIVVEKFGDCPLPNALFDGRASFSLKIFKKPFESPVAVRFWRENELPDSSGKFKLTVGYSDFDEKKLSNVITYFSNMDAKQ